MASRRHFVGQLIDAARRHGEDSDPEMEVGDLQALVWRFWEALTPEQRATLAGDDVLRDQIRDWYRP